MNFDLYQKEALKTAVFPDFDSNYVEGLIYPIIGLAGECGELSNKFKKVLRDHNGVVTGEMNKLLCDELGDCLWYIAIIAHKLNINLNTIATNNIYKLEQRKLKNTLKGDGDGR